MEQYDIGIIGSGPAGLTAALEVSRSGLSQIIIERESRPGGILKQCIHDGFGLQRFKERLTGPEYAERFLREVIDKQIPVYKNTFVTEAKPAKQGGYLLTLVNGEKGVITVSVKALILANGCRERTARQVFIHGTRPAGVYTAGAAQYLTNILGLLPCKKCVILGSGDIGLIMARRLTLECAKVIGVYEVKDSPSGLSRNISQCLEDYDIPLHLSSTVTKVHGENRVEAVTVQRVDRSMNPIPGTEEIIECDGLILSVGLIPENELAKSLGIELDPHTKGPYVNQCMMTRLPGCFSCGNALHVNDLVDYVSESAEIAARGAVNYVRDIDSRIISEKESLSVGLASKAEADVTEVEESAAAAAEANEKTVTRISNKKVTELTIPVRYNDKDFMYIVPQRIDTELPADEVHFYFRSSRIVKDASVIVRAGEEQLLKKRYTALKPPELETLTLEIGKAALKGIQEITFELIE